MSWGRTIFFLIGWTLGDLLYKGLNEGTVDVWAACLILTAITLWRGRKEE